MDDDKAFKVEDAGSYDPQADRYNKHICRLGAPLAERICQLAELTDGTRVLDIGTGSGLAARRAAQLVADSGSVLGVDLSAGMIESATKAGPLDKSASLEYRVMDAEHLDFPDQTFDAVISSCAVLHFPDIGKATREMYRVLKPAGRLAISYGHARPIALAPLMGHYVRRGAEELLRIAKPRLTAPADLLRIAAQFPVTMTQPMLNTWSTNRPTREICRALEAAGFKRVRTSWFGHRVYFDTAEEFVEAQAAISTLLRKRLQSLPPETSARLYDLLLARARQVREQGGQLVYPYGAVFFVSHRPAAPQDGSAHS